MDNKRLIFYNNFANSVFYTLLYNIFAGIWNVFEIYWSHVTCLKVQKFLKVALLLGSATLSRITFFDPSTSHCEVTIKTDRNINYTWPSTTKHTQTLVCNNDDMHARRVSLMERVFFYLFLQIFAFNLAHIYCTLKKVNQKTNPCTARVKRMYNLSRGMASLTTLFILHNLITRPEISQTNSPGLWYKRGDSPHVPKSIVTSTWICKPLQENSFKKNRIN